MSSHGLKKYSAGSTTETSFNKRDFTHLTDNELSLVYGGSSSERLTVIQRSKIWLDIPIRALVQASLRQKDDSQAYTYSREQLSIFAISKASQLALQFRLPEQPGVKHRIQATFKNEADAYLVTRQLLEAGMEVDDRNTQSLPDLSRSRPLISPTIGSVSDSMPTTTPGYQPRPSTAQSNSSILFSSSSTSPVLAQSGDRCHYSFGTLNTSGREPYTATLSPSPRVSMPPPPTTSSPTLSFKSTHSSSSLTNLIPSRRSLPAGFPPPSNSPTSSSHFPPPQGSTYRSPAPTSSTRVTRSSSQSSRITSPPRPLSAAIAAPAATIQSRPLILDERTTLIPPSANDYRPTNVFPTPLATSPETTLPHLTSSYHRPDNDTNPTVSRLEELAKSQGMNHEQLGLYAAQPQGQRQNVLDAMIVENLQNEDFKQLCRDVDACWRRVALGL
ncbi:hypothetical protein BDZ85DRAFT_109657 [Elsinoe ampelina]|uniref:Uncharacterized protein n=1 Tax=Elsinoe ampelina TaxID=302913 RepID=A0A6A6GD42_9PEZI|nr:hypothetical protein BDZ85DRAFT_109657 [Elsinoe ampelina]